MKRLLILILLSGTFCLDAMARSGEVGNGGDSVVQDFVYFGKETIKLLPFLKTRLISNDQILALKNAIQSAKIISADDLFLNAIEVDAINYPHEMKIEVSRKRWQSTNVNTRNARWALALHEYLWLAGIADSNYNVSNPLFADFLSAQMSWRSTPISRGLTETVCKGILGRDYATIEGALEMGADLSVSCRGGRETIDFTCADGRTEFITYLQAGYPLELAISLFGDNLCASPETRRVDPKKDQDMQKIFDLLLSFRPDLNRQDYGPLHNETLLSVAARNDILSAYQSLLNAGANPNIQSNFGGLLRWRPVPSIEFFKAASEAGADINVYAEGYKDIIISVQVLNMRKSDILEYLLTNHKIDFCLKTKNPYDSFNNQQVPLIETANPQLLPIIRRSGEPCT